MNAFNLPEMVAKWCMKTLDIGVSDLVVTMSTGKYPHDAKVNGFFYYEDDIGKIEIYKIASRKPLELIVTICHEFTHCVQWVNNCLRINDDHILFDGVKYAKPNTGPDYWNAPWEVEAREGEKILAEKFLRAHPEILSALTEDYNNENGTNLGFAS